MGVRHTANQDGANWEEDFSRFSFCITASFPAWASVPTATRIIDLKLLTVGYGTLFPLASAIQGSASLPCPPRTASGFVVIDHRPSTFESHQLSSLPFIERTIMLSS